MDAAAWQQMAKVTPIEDNYVVYLYITLFSVNVYPGEKWKSENFVCKYSDHAHPGVYNCSAVMRVRTKNDLSVAYIETARSHGNHRPVKDNGLSEQMKAKIVEHKDKTASQIRKEIMVLY